MNINSLEGYDPTLDPTYDPTLDPMSALYVPPGANMQPVVDNAPSNNSTNATNTNNTNQSNVQAIKNHHRRRRYIDNNLPVNPNNSQTTVNSQLPVDNGKKS